MDCKHIQNQSMGFSVAEIRQQKEFCQGVLQLFTSSLRVSSLGSETGCVCCTHLELPQNLSKYGVFFRSKKVSPKRHLTGFANFCKIPFPRVLFFCSVISEHKFRTGISWHGWVVRIDIVGTTLGHGFLWGLSCCQLARVVVIKWCIHTCAYI